MAYTFGDIADLIVEKGLVTKEQVKKARMIRNETNESLEVILTRLGFITKEEILEFISEKINIPYVNLDVNLINIDAAKIIDEEIAWKYKIIPLLLIADTLTVAMADPLDLFIIDSLKFISRYPIEPVLSSETDIIRAIEFVYKEDGRITKLAKDFKEEGLVYKKIDKEVELSPEIAVNQSPIIKLVDLLLIKAIKLKASDIHLESEEDFFRIRFRIDGRLHEIQVLPIKIRTSVMTRLKVMTDLDLTKSHTFQDGRFFAYYKNRRVDFRVATFPTANGENAVIRILDQENAGVDLKNLNFNSEDLKQIRTTLLSPNGIILVTGPTGSGKTTTLYACINEINNLTRKIITIEDPVEYRLENVNQIQVKRERGSTFAKALRASLRLDPDVILIGEIRDTETAKISIRGALTGHLILATLHTNGTVETIFRLMDMGVEPYFVREVVRTIISQRLIRRLCNNCKREVIVPVDELERVRRFIKKDQIKSFEPVGCDECRQTGFRGRTAITEFLFIGNKLRKAISPQAEGQQLREIALSEGMRSYWANAAEKLVKGITSYDELRNSYTAEFNV